MSLGVGVCGGCGCVQGGTPGRRCNRLENVDDDENSNGNEEDGDDGGDHLVWESHCP